EIADEEVRIEERQREGEAEDHDEDVPHAFLRVFGADADDFLAVLVGRGGGIEVHIVLDVNHGAIGAGYDRLGRSAGEPIDDAAAHDQPEDHFRLHDAQGIDDRLEHARGRVQFVHPLQEHDDAEDHGGGADDGGADQHGFGGGFEGVARTVSFFKLILAVFEVGFETEVLPDVFLDVRTRFNLAQLINGLRVVGDGAVAV